MAIGMTTQSGSLKKPCCPTFIWVTPTSSSSYYGFSSSIKAFNRPERLRFLHNADGPCSSITGIISSIQFKLNSSYCTWSMTMDNPMLMIDRKECFSPSNHRLIVRGEQRSSSTSSARMLPYPGRDIVESEVNWLEEESKASWLEASRELKEAKELNNFMGGMSSLGTPKEQNLIKSKSYGLKVLQDGGGYKKDGLYNSVSQSRLKHIPVLEASRSSLSRVYMGNGLENPQTRFSRARPISDNKVISGLGYPQNRFSRPQPISDEKIFCENGGDVGAPVIDKDSVSHMASFNEQVFKSHNIYNNSELAQAGSFTRNGILRNRVLLREEKLLQTDVDSFNEATEMDPPYGKSVDNSVLTITDVKPTATKDVRQKLCHIYDKVIVVDNVILAKKIVGLLTGKYRNLVHACDTEVAKINVKEETPVDHGEIICFSIYSGTEADFGDGKSCIWVDVLDGGKDLLMEFAPFFEDPLIKKVWHNYSFDSHVIENYGLELSGFHADTMHMARLWDSSRRLEGGYSLEALTSDSTVMSGTKSSTRDELIGKFSMKTIFGKRKIKKDGSEGKIITVAPVEELQREERIPWICYSALDSISTLKLFESLKSKLMDKKWYLDGKLKETMYNFYEKYWRPFGKLLVKMEAEGMLVDRSYLSEMEKLAIREQGVAANRFQKWASEYCPDALYMNIGSDTQLRMLFFGGTANRKDPNQELPEERIFKVPNVDKVIEEGKKVPTKFRSIKLHKIVDDMQTEMYTSSGWPSLCGDALKVMAGKVSSEYDWNDEEIPLSDGVDSPSTSENVDTSFYGTAYAPFGGGKKGREACHAIAALCEVCSIDSLISNFILPLQSSHISGKDGRVHCSLNINTETGRLSARRPNLQNQPALEKDRYKIRQAFIAAPGNSLIVADYGQLELRILAHLANCKSMLHAFEAGGDFHSRTAMNMYPHIRKAIEEEQVLLEWHPQPGEDKPPVPLLKDAFASERRKAKMLNFSIAYGKTPVGLARDWKVSIEEAKETVDLWYRERKEVLNWQKKQKHEARTNRCVHTLLGRARLFPSMDHASNAQRGHIERAAINTPVQGSAADVAMCAMLEISKNLRLKELGWKMLLQVHDEMILEGPTESAEEAKALVVECMSKPFDGKNFLKVDLSVDAKCAQNWYAAK